MDQHDYADPDLPPSESPSLGYLAALIGLSILFLVVMEGSLSRMERPSAAER